MTRLLPILAGFAAVCGLALPLYSGAAGAVMAWSETGALIFALAVLVMAGENLISLVAPPQGRSGTGASRPSFETPSATAPQDDVSELDVTTTAQHGERYPEGGGKTRLEGSAADRAGASWFQGLSGDIIIAVIAHLGAWELLSTLSSHSGAASGGFWALLAAAWLTGWIFVERLANRHFSSKGAQRTVSVVIPLLFGVWVLILWQALVIGFGVPKVLLPAPSEIWVRLVGGFPTPLWDDFRQTFLKAVLIGYGLGCGSGFLVAILVDRVPFLKRGLLPVGNLVSALPIVGVAPIMVMWFGFDWPSKAAVVIIMTFFPMLVNTVTGLAASDHMQRDLMRTYAANHWQTLVKLRLPQALPFIFNALKINSTLALIGAIVAEFFGTPTVGMGFRISTEVGRMNVDMVWAEIAVAALAGSAFYGVMTLLERVFTFWHPSFRT